MEPFSVTILGSGAAVPAKGRNPTAQWVQCRNRNFLLDCGEGTQLQIRRYGLGFKHLKGIFISHLHGDHYFGLFGLLSTLSLIGRQEELIVVGPAGLKEILDTVFKESESGLRFPLIFRDVEDGPCVFEDSRIKVIAFPVKHRIPTWGYRVQEKPAMRHLDGEKANRDGIPGVYRRMLKEGKDVEWEGRTYRSEDYTLPADRPRSYAYGADSAPCKSLEEGIRGVDLAYLEATFVDEHKDRAAKTRHMTAAQAARLGKDAGVCKLILGHFSARYTSLYSHIEEAKKENPDVELATEGTSYPVESGRS